MVQRPSPPDELDALGERIRRWLAAEQETNPVLAAVEEEPEERRWYLRVNGEAKEAFTIRLRLGQRSLHYETYVMPAPEENEAAFYKHLLRRNTTTVGMSFQIGEEDAIFLAGSLVNGAVDEDELDRIVGSVFAYVEQYFHPALRIGFASRLGLSR